MLNPDPEIPRVLEDIPESEQHALLEKAATWIVRRGSDRAGNYRLGNLQTAEFFGQSIFDCI